ncbi:MAG: ABC transporter permease, partial [Bdellovibrionales bacterium]
MVALRLIAQSLLRERRLFGLWVASLCVAVSGLLIVDVFRNSLSQTLVTQGQNILTADVAVNSRRSLNANELAQIKQLLPGDARFSTLTEMFAMVSHSESGPTGTRLGSLRFIDDSYPLRGELLIERAGKILPLQGSALGMEASAWVAPDFLSLMNVRVGDTLKIGEVQFRIDGVVRKDSSQTFRFGSMAPRIFLHRKFLEKTKLVQFGSTFSENLFAAVTAPQPDLKIKLENLFADPSVQITVPTDLEQGSLRVLTRLLDFLGLTGLVTLCLGWIGVYYLGRRWLSLESSSAGVLKCLGFSNGELQRYLLLKLLIIMLAGILSGGLLAWLGAGAVLPFVQDSMPTEFNLSWSWSSTLLLILVGPVAGILLMLPSLRAVGREQPLVLIQGTAAFRTSLSDFFAFAATTAVLFSAITFVQARSWRVTFIFLGSLLCTLLVVAGLGLCVIAISRKWQNSPRSWKIHLALSQWNRRRALALLLVMVSAMAGLLSQLIPNIEKTLVS